MVPESVRLILVDRLLRISNERLLDQSIILPDLGKGGLRGQQIRRGIFQLFVEQRIRIKGPVDWCSDSTKGSPTGLGRYVVRGGRERVCLFFGLRQD